MYYVLIRTSKSSSGYQGAVAAAVDVKIIDKLNRPEAEQIAEQINKANWRTDYATTEAIVVGG